MMEWLKVILNKSVPLEQASDMSKSWDTCAVGEARKCSLTTLVPGLGELGRGDIWVKPRPPTDKRLATLGIKFDDAVRKGQRSEALKLYLDIQKRIATLAGVR